MQRRIELEPDLQVGSLIRIKFVHFYTGNSAELRNDSRLFGLVEFAGVRKRNTIGYVKNHWCKVNKRTYERGQSAVQNSTVHGHWANGPQGVIAGRVSGLPPKSPQLIRIAERTEP